MQFSGLFSCKMAPARTLAILGVICSFLAVSAVRSGFRAEGDGKTNVLLNNGVSSDHAVNLRTMVAANCSRLTVRGGLDTGESIKVTLGGWNSKEADLQVLLVSDGSSQAAQLRFTEETAKNILEKTAQEQPPILGGIQGEERKPYVENDGGSSSKNGVPLEPAVVPLIGIVIPGMGSNRTAPAVLEYVGGSGTPTETVLKSPAGPDTPVMIIFYMKTASEMEVTLYTWIQEANSKETSGSWNMAVTTVGISSNSRDLMVSVNDVGAKTLKMYASSTASILTAQADACGKVEVPLISIVPSSNGNGPDAHETIKEKSDLVSGVGTGENPSSSEA